MLSFLIQLTIKFIRRIKRSLANETPVEHIELLSKSEYQFEQSLARKYDGKLLTRSELNLSETLLTTLLEKRLLMKKSAIKKTLFTAQCYRCGNDDSTFFGTIPCIHCQKDVIYCRKCIMMGRVTQCDSLYYYSGRRFSWPKINSPCTWDGKLNEYQRYAANKMVTNFVNRKNILIWAVTGSGKTEMTFPVITKALQSGKRVCLATPRKDVVLELLPRFQQSFQNVSIQALYGGSKDKGDGAQFIISTTHQLIRFQQAFDLLIIDEVDAFPYSNEKTLQYVTKRSRKSDGVSIYLTATPNLKQKWQMRLNKLDYAFVPSRYHGHSIPVPKLFYIHNLSSYLHRFELPPQLFQQLTSFIKQKRQLLIFVPTIQLAERLVYPLRKKVNLCRTRSIHFVHAEDDERHEKIMMFRKRKIDILITTTILERGVTFPSINVIVLQACHFLFDEAALIQIAGRAGRSQLDPKGEVIFIHEGKTNAIIKAIDSINDMNERASGKVVKI